MSDQDKIEHLEKFVKSVLFYSHYWTGDEPKTFDKSYGLGMLHRLNMLSKNELEWLGYSFKESCEPFLNSDNSVKEMGE